MLPRCCVKRREVQERIEFAQKKLDKELDLTRFISLQRETYMTFLMTMTGPE